MTLNDTDYLLQFERRELGPEHFDHVGHLRMAWLHLEHYAVDEAIARVCGGIRDLANKFGVPEKFNHTLSEALMRVMFSRMQNSKEDYAGFLRVNQDLVLDAEAVLARHYSRARLNSEQARSAWLGPDREPLNEL